MRRQAEKDRFLAQIGWAQATVTPLAGDASLRSYDRVETHGKRAVLMNAPPDHGESTDPFLRIARHLSVIGLHPPAILGEDRSMGFLLLEDLGDRLFAREFERDPDLQHLCYTEALRALKTLHDHPAPELPGYGRAEMAQAAGLAATWYAGDPDAAVRLRKVMEEALATLDWSRHVPVLRDYHAENLIWCPEETGLRRVGLLDFQDAGLGHPVYDAASLLQDARRDLDPDLVARLSADCWSWFAADRAAFTQAFAVLGAQRALRILGVFARLSLHFDKPRYVDLIPRVWGQLQGNLDHPALRRLADTTHAILPEPSTAHLDDLKARAGSCPAL
ncbi:aminoglycoside phosphotransferase [Dinoroseobacter shibae DFL 12 = DSM 16493]|jgi:aminoglycoside/choline kinase family phosphotransferase|uniref:Aminoglycoside phosphotransferase n=1 Tax=Dinoroseobacter shibae (strain DSM 16493 / NCIMB 14021 / DFL 12) TaxID=398580 RepID=A8LPA3_DINSH|nr:phosphotransferase [Dinoroseobacter shibae]ABV95168.1 aminoglycoside phosphotransferase [Dinoroseobacter shibae DFL 12 = DSM 16493]URF46581.1 phosphotransferase [Dinoroseobacter shibae]URF50887.1 phosphotransferase [Dinoroseobacter shibae]